MIFSRVNVTASVFVLAFVLLLPMTGYAPGVPGQIYSRSFEQDASLVHHLDQIWIIDGNALVALKQSDRADGLWDRTAYYYPPNGFDLASFDLDGQRRTAVLLIVKQDPDNIRTGPVTSKVIRLDLQSRAEVTLFETTGAYTTGVVMVSSVHLGPNGAVAVETEFRSQKRCRVYLSDGRAAFDDDATWVGRFGGFSLDGTRAFGIIDGGAGGQSSYLRSVDLRTGQVSSYTFPNSEAISFLPRHEAVVAGRSNLDRKEFWVTRVPSMEELSRKTIEGYAAPLDDIDRRLTTYAMTDRAVLSWEENSDIYLPMSAGVQILAEHPTERGYIYLRNDRREVISLSYRQEGVESLGLFNLEGEDPHTQSGPTLLIEQARSLFWGEVGALQLIAREWNRLYILDFNAEKYCEVQVPLPQRKEEAWYRLDRKAVIFLK